MNIQNGLGDFPTLCGSFIDISTSFYESRIINQNYQRA